LAGDNPATIARLWDLANPIRRSAGSGALERTSLAPPQAAVAWIKIKTDQTLWDFRHRPCQLRVSFG